MKRRTAWTTLSLVAFAIQCTSTSAWAIPKAAEHENAPVTFGAEAPRPKNKAVIKKDAHPKVKSSSRAKQTHAVASKHRK